MSSWHIGFVTPPCCCHVIFHVGYVRVCKHVTEYVFDQMHMYMYFRNLQATEKIRILA